ncbi:MAG TPA: hypothetical protein VIH61_04695, partial [Waddliaceae bacterium]
IISLTNSVGFMPDYVAWGSDKIQRCNLNLNIPYSLYAAYPLNENLSRNAELFLKITNEIFLLKTVF